MGKGFSLKAEQGSASLPLTFRFPKEHTEYEYVNTSNQGTGIKETITRSSIGRFIYENSTQGVSFPISVTLTNKQAGTYFLAGNMFMSHLNISEFMNQNPAVKSVQVYDGNSNNSNINANGQLLNNGAGYTRIAPMQSFFISVASAATSQTIKYTESMLVSAPGPDNKLKSADSSTQEDPSALYLTATTSQAVSNALLRFNPASDNKYVAGEDAELLIDNEIRPTIAIFSVANGKALDIQQLQDIHMFPRLGHDPFIGRDDQKYEIDAADACQHVLYKFFMSGDIDDADVCVGIITLHFGKTKLNGNAALLFFF